jgi:hypothetical protein
MNLRFGEPGRFLSQLPLLSSELRDQLVRLDLIKGIFVP